MATASRFLYAVVGPVMYSGSLASGAGFEATAGGPGVMARPRYFNMVMAP